ncbi:ABC transporter substrate-binding protein [Paenibacillus xylanexedens]|uniref:ABC transporter substrate-binding protein n=1 Tax=Paenibacillus xylanexedens TaxID=528191 RepID=UPI0021B1CB7A|nr:ABC transporter substrate-binding protein [Paenibacillus xylanexedens]
MHRMGYKGWVLVVALFCFVLLMAACSAAPKTEQSQSNIEQSTATNGEGADEAATSTETGTDTYPRTIQTARGDMEIEQQPKKIALAHWGLSDDLLVFDLDSVAITLPFTEEQSLLKSDIYKPYVEGISNLEVVGENTQVNLEALLAYEPDLIIAGNVTNKDILEQLDQIAPTVVVDEEKQDVFKEWRAVITEFGHILGQEDAAKAYTDDFEQKLVEGKNKLQSVEGSVAFLQIREKQAYLQSAEYITEYYEGLGLTPPATEAAGELTLEGIAKLDPDYLILGYFNMEDSSLPAVTDEWEKSEVWKGLKAVKNGQVYKINGQVAFGFGPVSKTYGVETITESLQAK